MSEKYFPSIYRVLDTTRQSMLHMHPDLFSIVQCRSVAPKKSRCEASRKDDDVG